ncbi:YwbE family protein [Neobacillus sp. YIM B02564]|uniref:YwbE family protein n=1 Tax=Neobacillus paridis TaxID=2803862 RepID=A0ABS1TLL1_9BACI|nr:YwbE family protein [Neobacillus paridis]
MNPCVRSDIQIGMEVRVVLKKDQPTGKLTSGVVKDILTNQEYHPRGIKVRLINGKVGRIQEIVSPSLSGKKLWDCIIECRACSSITELSQHFAKGEIYINGEKTSDPDIVLEDGRYIIRIGKEHSLELYLTNGEVRKQRTRKM